MRSSGVRPDGCAGKSCSLESHIELRIKHFFVVDRESVVQEVSRCFVHRDAHAAQIGSMYSRWYMVAPFHSK